jgi:RNA polymerase primary sigma factor
MDSFGVYLEEISRYPLLSGAQEIELFRSISAAAALQDTSEPLTKQQQRVIKRGALAKTRLINSNLRLVVHIAKRYIGVAKNLDMLDIVQEGTIGLIRAAELFDGARGYKFSTYAYWWIRQNIQRGIDTKSRIIRVPVHVAEMFSKIRKAKHELGISLGRSATNQELADFLDITVDKLYEIVLKENFVLSLDQPIAQKDGEMNLGSVVADKTEAVFTGALDKISSGETCSVIMQCMDRLDPKHKYVLLHRLGIEGYEIKTLSEIGLTLGISRERSRQVYDRALKLLRRTLRVHKYFTHFKFGDMPGSVLDDLHV